MRSLVEHHFDVPLPHLKLVILYDIKRSLDTASVRTKLNFSLGEVPHD